MHAWARLAIAGALLCACGGSDSPPAQEVPQCIVGWWTGASISCSMGLGCSGASRPAACSSADCQEVAVRGFDAQGKTWNGTIVASRSADLFSAPGTLVQSDYTVNGEVVTVGSTSSNVSCTSSELKYYITQDLWSGYARACAALASSLAEGASSGDWSSSRGGASCL